MNYLVIKCGGSILEKLPNTFYEDIVALQKKGQFIPVIVHGGGPLISKLLEQLNIETTFHHGLRITTAEVLDVVEWVLSGSINKKIVRAIKTVKGNAFGFSGIDGHLLKAKPHVSNSPLGFVGSVTDVNSELLKQITKNGHIPVISPLAMDEEGQRYNINGDTAAAAIAQALEAPLCFISDVPGIMAEENGEKAILNHASQSKIEALINTGIIQGGMLPKVQAALDSLEQHVPEVVILNGLAPQSLLDFVAGKPVGTKITIDKEAATHA